MCLCMQLAVNVIDRDNGHYMGQLRIARKDAFRLRSELWLANSFLQEKFLKKSLFPAKVVLCLSKKRWFKCMQIEG